MWLIFPHFPCFSGVRVEWRRPRSQGPNSQCVQRTFWKSFPWWHRKVLHTRKLRVPQRESSHWIYEKGKMWKNLLIFHSLKSSFSSSTMYKILFDLKNFMRWSLWVTLFVCCKCVGSDWNSRLRRTALRYIVVTQCLMITWFIWHYRQSQGL